MLTWRPKYEAEIARYFIDWSATLNADEIDTSTWEVLEGSAVIDSESIDGQSAFVIVSGGTAGETTRFQNTITTVGGFTYVEVVDLAVLDLTTAAVPRTTRKRVLIEMAVEELRLAGYEWNFTPEEYSAALRRLDGVAAEYPASGYNTPSTFGAGEVDDMSGLQDAEVRDFALLLAEATAPSIGKTLSRESMRRVAAARVRLNARYAVLPTVQPRANYPLGSGHRVIGRGLGQFSTLADE